jgi:type VI secretion system protein ImpK
MDSSLSSGGYRSTAGSSAPPQTENLALAYQEPLTAILRLRYNRQPVVNAESFRANMRAALNAAEQLAVRRGYSAEDARLATFAVVAFLDHSVPSSPGHGTVFADWQTKLMQEELFGNLVAGEPFYENLRTLLERRDSPALADLLEVYLLCLLLGYPGRYGAAGQAESRNLIESLLERIRNVRGPQRITAPPGALPPESAPPTRRADPWIRRLVYALGIALLLLVLSFGGFWLRLHSGVGVLQAIVADNR